MFRTRQEFYKSKEWESFRQVVIAERTDSDGYVHCAVCGKPILKKYDLIVHHKKELDDLNINDAMVSLNPDNCECVHFKCHNQIHERFGFHKGGTGGGFRPVPKKVYIVYGSPCSGKTTWVHENATGNDLVVDMDSLWQMISINRRYEKPAALKGAVFQIRDAMYDLIKYRSGNWHNAFVIVGGALKGDRDRLVQRIGADELIYIDTAMDVCVQRLEKRIDMNEDTKAEWLIFIQKWFETYQPD